MKPAPLTALLLGLVVSVANAQTKEIAVDLRSPQDVAALAALGLDTAGRWPEVRVYGGAGALAALEKAGLRHEVIHHDVEAFYASRLQVIGTHQSLSPPFGQGSMGGYYTYAEVTLAMDSLQALYPNVMAPKVQLGTSIEGRPIWMWKISDSPTTSEAEPRVLIDGGHHAREPMSVQACVWLAKELCEQYGTNSESTDIVDKRELFIVPLVNPDGYVYNETTMPNGGGMWRKNRRLNADGSHGVDPNRNYGYQWGIDNVGSSPVMSDPEYRGTAPFSEPCTAAMSAFAQNAGLSAVFTMHSYGGMVFIPPNYTFTLPAPGPVTTIYETYAAEMAAFAPGYATGYSAPLLSYTSNGTAQDWHHGALQVFAFGAELGDATDGFWPATSRIIPICRDAMPYMKHVIRVAGSDPRIEDVAVTENPGGSLNGIWDPGESLAVVATVSNGGLASDVFDVSVESTSPWLAITNSPAPAGTLASNGGTGDNSSSPVIVTVDPASPLGQVLTFDVVVRGPAGIVVRQSVSQPVGLPLTTVFSQTFENGAAGWTVNSPVSSNGDWVLDDPIATTFAGQTWNPGDDHSVNGTECWFTGQVPAGGGGTHATHDVDGITSLISPTLDASGVQDAKISFWRWFAASNVGAPRMEVWLSNDDGTTWSQVMTFDVNQPSWIEETLRIEDHMPRTSAMRIKFTVIDYPNQDVTEAAIDDLRLHGFQPAFDLTFSGPPTVGGSVGINITAPHFAGQQYLLGVSRTAHVGIDVGIGIVPLDFDDLFPLVSAYPSVFVDFSGTISSTSTTAAHLTIPSVPNLSGLTFFVSGVSIDGTPAVTGIAGGHRFILP